MLRTLIALSMIAVPATAAVAQTGQKPDPNRITAAQVRAKEKPIADTAQSNTPPAKVRSVTLEGDEKCPKAKGDEVIVCSRINPDDQFRIPKQFRRGPPPAANKSWATRTQTMDDVARTAAGLPNTCSVVGSGGQTGCSAQMARDWAADRRERKREQESIP